MVGDRRSPQDWFRDLGYQMDVSQDGDGGWWASLISLSNVAYRVEKYGRGDTAELAAERARRRWQVEQIGSPADEQSGERHLPG